MIKKRFHNPRLLRTYSIYVTIVYLASEVLT